VIYYLDLIHRPYVLQPQRFEGWFFPRHQVKPTLLGPVVRATLLPRAIIILILSLHFAIHNQIFAKLECMANVLSTQCPPIEASSIDRTQQSRFHLMTTEEPSLETLWLQNIRTMNKVQIIYYSNTAPSSKTFRDELSHSCLLHALPISSSLI
jgi:hypothetical protein